MGEQLIRMPLDMLHSLLTNNISEMQGWEFPRSVDILGIYDDPPDKFCPDRREATCLLHVQHKYCFRRPRGAQLCIEDYMEFVERLRSIARTDMHI